MCFVLYAGTRSPLPRKTWTKDAPDLSVKDLTDRDGPIKAHFRNPEVQYIGSTSGCGCDFPHATFQNGEWPEISYRAYRVELEDPESLASDRRNRKALVDCLRKSNERLVELYGIWDGDFTEVPQARESIILEDLLDSDFLLKERGFYKVVISE
jgi:hypothetical protein